MNEWRYKIQKYRERGGTLSLSPVKVDQPQGFGRRSSFPPSPVPRRSHHGISNYSCPLSLCLLFACVPNIDLHGQTRRHAFVQSPAEATAPRRVVLLDSILPVASLLASATPASAARSGLGKVHRHVLASKRIHKVNHGHPVLAKAASAAAEWPAAVRARRNPQPRRGRDHSVHPHLGVVGV